jgi:citrate synthase
MLRSAAVGGKSRARRYRKDDVTRLIERKEFRKNPATVVARSLHWGTAVLESGLTLIEGNRLFYRGIDATALAQHATVEEVAALMWLGDASRAGDLFATKSPGPPAKIVAFLDRAPHLHLGPIERCQLVLPLAAAADLSAYDLRPTAAARTGARILRLLLAAICGGSAEGPMDIALTEAWTAKRKATASAVRAALILCADHELNVSAFTARCIASSQATPYDVVLGALAALRGRRHGGATPEVDTLFREAEGTHRYRDLVAKRLRSFGGVPGFGHRLYPGGDPRAQMLISLAQNQGRESAVELASRLMQAAHALTGEPPNLDFGLVTLARALDLPSESPIALFALGRSVGWIAHAIEQYSDHQLIRPRAQYVGAVPAVP